MKKSAPRYTGIVKLGATYVTPAGVTATPIAFRMDGITVDFSGGNFAFTKVVARSEFATYTLQEVK